MIWRVGALRGHLSCYMCVDTGAMNELMIIREKHWFESITEIEGTLGTATEGGVLPTRGVGSAGTWDNVVWAPKVSYSVVSGQRVREKGYVLIDSNPPVLATPGRFDVVLVGKHIEGMPCFEMVAFLGLLQDEKGARQNRRIRASAFTVTPVPELAGAGRPITPRQRIRGKLCLCSGWTSRL
jgi:hypothetical protein